MTQGNDAQALSYLEKESKWTAFIHSAALGN